MSGGIIQPELVKSILRDVIRLVFGVNGSRILELHLGRMLRSDPYDVFCENPKLFCDGLRSFFGNGTKGLLQVLAKTLIKQYRIRDMSPEELIDLLNRGDVKSKNQLFTILCSSYYMARGGEL